MKTLTTDQLFHMVWTEHWNTPRFIRSRWASEAARNYENHIAPHFATKRVGSLTAKEIRAWHKGMADRPFAANRSLEILSKMFTFAEEAELKPQGTNPCSLVKAHPERTRKRFATNEEIQKIDSILRRYEASHPREVAFIYLLMYSGARPISIERATWQELKMVDHGNYVFGVLTFNGKSTAATGEDEQVIIPPQGMRLLAALPKNSVTITDIKMPRNFWNKVRKEAGCEDLWVRDWRRTFATIGLSNGQSSGVIGELLNHHSAQTTKLYTQLIQTKKIATTELIANEITKIADGA